LINISAGMSIHECMCVRVCVCVCVSVFDQYWRGYVNTQMCMGVCVRVCVCACVCVNV